MADDKRRRSLISLGEVIALAALIVSGFGAWIAWRSSNEDKPTRIVEQRQSTPLVLRARTLDEGRSLDIEPVEPSHALQSLTISVPGSKTLIDAGSDGKLSAREAERVIGPLDEAKSGNKARIRIAARYVEAGADRTSTANYVLSYRWEGGGLFSGRSMRLTGLSR